MNTSENNALENKMSPGEALNYISGLHIMLPRSCGKTEGIRFLKAARTALEKQTLQKPSKSYSMGNTYYNCPNCKTDVSPDRYGINEIDSYCHNCGQALDWGGSDNGNS